MAKWSELKSYKVAISGGAAGVWEVRDEFVCEERTQIIGYFGSIINTGGTHGAMAISKSGHVNPGVELQTNVLAYWESQAGEFMQETFFYPTDCRPEFDKDDRIYGWLEKVTTGIHHLIMWYREYT